MFNVAPTKVATPEVPVVVKVIAFCLLLKVVKSAEAKYPLTEVVAAGIEIVFVVLTKAMKCLGLIAFQQLSVQLVLSCLLQGLNEGFEHQT